MNNKYKDDPKCKGRKPSNTKGKGKSNFKRSDYTKDSDIEKKDLKGMCANDISWYAQSPQLLKDTANLQWSFQTGNTFTVNKRDYTVPGIYVSHLMHGIGNDPKDNYAIKTAANAIYTVMRAANSGGRNYNAPAVMMYLLAYGEVYAAISWLMRLYGTIYSFSAYNRYLPEALIRAQGVNYDNLKSNMTRFRARINYIINKAATYAVPSNIPYFRRMAWLYSSYYIEGDNIKDQIYLHNPYFFRKYVIPAEGGPAALIRVKIGERRSRTIGTGYDYNELLTVDQICDAVESMITAILDDDDLGVIAGDIRKAYGTNLLYLSEIPETYAALIVPNNEVLLQFKNARPLGYVPTYDISIDDLMNDNNPYTDPCFGDIYESIDQNTIIQYSRITGTGSGPARREIEDGKVLTIAGEASPEMNMIITRDTCVRNITIDESDDSVIADYYYSTDVPVFMHIVTDARPYSTLDVYGTINSNSDGMELVGRLSNFKYHCEVVIADAPNTYNSAFQVDNYCIAGDDEICNMHRTAIISEFNIPNGAAVK